MAMATMDIIQRQQNTALKKAVELAAKDRGAEALQHVPTIIEIKDPHARQEAIAQAYVTLSETDREKTILVTGTNEARRYINQHVRLGLDVTDQDITCDTLIRRDTTQAERLYAKHYHINDIIQPERNYPRIGLIRGERYQIEEITPGNRLMVRSLQDNKTLSFNPANYRKLSVYEPDEKELSVGDRVRITRNDKELDVANGDRFKVIAVSQESITLKNADRTITLDTTQPLHLDYAYATTVHSSQGLTCDRVLIDVPTHSKTTAKDVFYVALSRARLDAQIYTNDKNHLPEAILRKNVKSAALDLVKKDRGERGK